MLWAITGILLMIGALLLIPFGVPGLWIMIAVIAVGAYAGTVAPLTLAVLVLAATVAEVLEFLLVKRYSARYGGTNRAFWGALGGGLIGVFIGLPVPLIGSVLAGILGSFVGAGLVTLAETRHVGSAARVGWGVTLARVSAIAVKIAAGIAILAVGTGALITG